MNREEQRKRLMDLLRNSPHLNVMYSEWEIAAEWLLLQGVIVPPCKIGDDLWYISTENPYVAFEKELKARKSEPVAGILITKDDVYISSYNIDEVKGLCHKINEDYAYLSKEEAEKAIKEKGAQEND